MPSTSAVFLFSLTRHGKSLLIFLTDTPNHPAADRARSKTVTYSGYTHRTLHHQQTINLWRRPVVLAFFCIVVLIFLALSLVSHHNIKKQYIKRMDGLETRYESLEKQYDRLQNNLTEEQDKSKRLSNEVSELTTALAEREKLIRLIQPPGGITPLEIMRMKGLVSNDTIRMAREYIVKSQVIKDVEDVLVEQNIIHPAQLQEMRNIVEQFHKRRRPSRSTPTQ
jgi:uncharacterized coiled-coil protein SlyX